MSKHVNTIDVSERCGGVCKKSKVPKIHETKMGCLRAKMVLFLLKHLVRWRRTRTHGHPTVPKAFKH